VYGHGCLSFRGNFLVIFPLQHDSTLKKTFQSKEFFEKWNDYEKPQKKSEKRELAKDKWYNQMGQVGTSWSTWDKWDKEKGVFRSTWDKWDKEKGVFRSSWDKWDKDKGSVQLNHSTCPKVGLQGQVGTSGTGTGSIVGIELVPGQGKASSVGI